jgi:hypothetical protein
MIIEHTLHILKKVLEQNYFQHNNQSYQPNKGITMGSLISSTLADISLQYLEEKYMKNCLEHKDVIYYRRYVCDLLIIYDQSRINADKILKHFDNHLDFKISEEVNNTLQYLDLSFSRNDDNIELDIYRKPKFTVIMVHYNSNHPYDHKLAVFIFILTE